MKKLITILLTVFLITGLCACNKKEEEKPDISGYYRLVYILSGSETVADEDYIRSIVEPVYGKCYAEVRNDGTAMIHITEDAEFTYDLDTMTITESYEEGLVRSFEIVEDELRITETEGDSSATFVFQKRDPETDTEVVVMDYITGSEMIGYLDYEKYADLFYEEESSSTYATLTSTDGRVLIMMVALCGMTDENGDAITIEDAADQVWQLFSEIGLEDVHASRIVFAEKDAIEIDAKQYEENYTLEYVAYVLKNSMENAYVAITASAPAKGAVLDGSVYHPDMEEVLELIGEYRLQ